MIPATLDRLTSELGSVSVVRMARTKKTAVIALRKIPTPRTMKPIYRNKKPFAEEAL
jgi:hypothetical protein